MSKETIEKNIKFKKAVAEYFKGLESPLIHAYKEFVKNWDPVKDFDNEILANHRKNTDADTAKYLFCLTETPAIYYKMILYSRTSGNLTFPLTMAIAILMAIAELLENMDLLQDYMTRLQDLFLDIRVVPLLPVMMIVLKAMD